MKIIEKKRIALLICLVLLASVLTGCAKPAADPKPISVPVSSAPSESAETEAKAEAKAEEPAPVETAAPAPAADPAELYKNGMQLGSSPYKLTGIAGFKKDSSIKADAEDGFIGYYENEDGVGMDIYEFMREGRSLEEYTNIEVEQYSGYDVQSREINGINVMSYLCREEDDTAPGTFYTTANYLFVYFDSFIELVFWLNDEDTAPAEALIATLAPLEAKTISLGTTPYTLTVHEFFEDRFDPAEVFPDKDHTAYYFYSRGLSIDTFAVSAEQVAGRSLGDYAKDEAEKLLNGSFRAYEINGIPYACYEGIAVYPNGKSLDSEIYVVEDGDGFLEICFAKFSIVGDRQVDDIMATLTK